MSGNSEIFFSSPLKNLEMKNCFESRCHFDFSLLSLLENFLQPFPHGDFNFNFLGRMKICNSILGKIP